MDKGLMAEAFAGFEQRLQAVDASQWGSGTPCAEWDVHTLVNHVAGELLWIPPLLDGRTIAEVGDRLDGDILGADPLTTWRSAAMEALASASAPGVDERIVHLSFGDFPGSEYLGQVTADVVIHSWDLARATGGDERLDAGLVAFAAAFLAPQIELWRGAGAFGPAHDVAADADDQAAFLAQTGRG